MCAAKRRDPSGGATPAPLACLARSHSEPLLLMLMLLMLHGTTACRRQRRAEARG
jgi:hypothetical protein